MEQAAIALTGVIAIYLSQQKNHQKRRFACLFGLLGQPFWFYSSWTNEQWGIVMLCVFYTWAWFKGVQTYWLSGRK